MNTTIETIRKYATERISESDKVINECNEKRKTRSTSYWLEGCALDLVFHEELKNLWQDVDSFVQGVERDNIKALLVQDAMVSHLINWRECCLQEVLMHFGSRSTNPMVNLCQDQKVNAKKEFIGCGAFGRKSMLGLINMLKKEGKGE